MNLMEAPVFSIFYDGGCSVCGHEIDFYRTKKGAERLRWVDISVPGFDAVSEGLHPEEIRRFFHVRDEQGNLIVGVPAFVEIWKRLPALSLWAKAAGLPGAGLAMNLGYAAFVRVRPYLPRRPGTACIDGSCTVRNQK